MSRSVRLAFPNESVDREAGDAELVALEDGALPPRRYARRLDATRLVALAQLAAATPSRGATGAFHSLASDLIGAELLTPRNGAIVDLTGELALAWSWAVRAAGGSCHEVDDGRPRTQLVVQPSATRSDALYVVTSNGASLAWCRRERAVRVLLARHRDRLMFSRPEDAATVLRASFTTWFADRRFSVDVRLPSRRVA